ncbi:aminotransferase class V-fold PLP-dependent enzyme, partial [Chloroflexota bacterium]
PTQFFMRRKDEVLHEARQPLGAYLNTNPDNLLFVTNATTGGNQIVNSLHLEPGDEILTSDQEYGAMENMWQAFCQRTGARLIRQEIPLPFVDVAEVVETLWQAVTPRTRIIFLSHITSPTALIFPIAEICARARAAGILTVIDGAHAPGQIPLDLDNLGADFYVGNCHKWMCSPKGAGFLYTRPDHQEQIRQLIVGWETGDAVDYIRRNQWTGTRDLAAFLAVPAAIEFMEQNDWATVQQRCHEQASQLRQQLHDELGATLISADSPTWYAQMFSVWFPPTDDIEQLKKTLYEKHHIQLAAGEYREHLSIRISVQAYNSAADLATTRQVLQEALAKQKVAG